MKKAFTLVELVAVMAIVALTAHLAMRALGTLAETRKRTSAQRRMEEIRDGIWKVDSSGSASGFLADTGRLPRRLAELVERPAGLGEYAVKEAGHGIYVASGWKGPYVRLEAGRGELLDPWGNEFLAETNALGFVTGVSHMGESGQPRTKSALFSVVPPGGEKARIVVSADSAASMQVKCHFADGAGGVTNVTGQVSAAAECLLEGIAPGLVAVEAGGMVRGLALKAGETREIHLGE